MLDNSELASLNLEQLEKLKEVRKSKVHERLYTLHKDRKNIDDALQEFFRLHISVKSLSSYLVRSQGVGFFTSDYWQEYPSIQEYMQQCYNEDEAYFVNCVGKVRAYVLDFTFRPNMLDPRPPPKTPRERKRMTEKELLEYDMHYNDEKYWRTQCCPLKSLYEDLEAVMVSIYRYTEKLEIADMIANSKVPPPKEPTSQEAALDLELM